MNVIYESQFSTSRLAESENSVTTTYSKPSTRTESTWGSGCSLDIADKVMDNEAYRGHGKTIEDLMQQAGNADVQNQKDFMLVMSSCVSGEDLQKMQEEGFHPGSTDVETYVSIVDKIKVTLARAGVEIVGYNDNIDVDTIEEITGSRVDANALIKDLSALLKESDMPVTTENIAELTKAVMEASGITEISDDAIKYMVINGKEPTIENLYKAQFSSAAGIKQAQGYYSDSTGGYGKYYAKKADSINWDNLKDRMETVVKQAGLDGDAKTKAAAMENAKWLVSSGIELNSKNLTTVSDLKSMEFPMKQEEVLDLCVTALGNGKAPIKALLTGETPIAEQAQQLVETVETISDEAVHATVESGAEVNIKNLAAAQTQIDAQGTSQQQNTVAEASLTDVPLKEIETRRQLEEIRLIMSEEANRHLLKNGISIDTTELSKLVEALKAAEENIKAAMFQGANAEENNQMAQIYEETLTKTKELSQMPAAVIGKVAASAQSYTLTKLHKEGEELQNQLQDSDKDGKDSQNVQQMQAQSQNQDEQSAGRNGSQQQKQAMASYEALMTAPRKDLGDRISKAFRNVDDILQDMGLETSEPNRRAVRILGYNSMEITQENIDAVKEADSKICGVIDRMTPGVTLQMIREQKNPLEMTMEELDEYLNKQDRDYSADTERFSKFLQKLDRTNGISQEEREAYIGIYRMFRQIEKSDGAVVGSIVATGAEMNFKNMLSAVRTRADKNMDVRVNDEFGALENLITNKKAIDEQIMSGYQNQENEGSAENQEKEQYYARLSGEINEELADKTDIGKLKESSITAETTIEQFADQIKTTQMSENAEMEQKAENLRNFQRSMQEAEKIDDDIIQTLIDYGQKISADNIEAASMLMTDRGALFRQVFGQKSNKAEDVPIEKIQNTKNMAQAAAQNTQAQESSENTASAQQAEQEQLLAASDNFIDNLTDAKSADTSYQAFLNEANKAVENMVYQSGTSHIDVKAAKALYKGLSLAGNLAREENYEIPVDIKGEITSVNLKIYHNTLKTGKVSITLENETLGKVAAEFDVKKGRISGMVAYSNIQNKHTLDQVEQSIEKELSQNANTKVSISMVHSKNVDFNRFGEDRDSNVEQVSTKELYQTAKAFMTALKEIA